jgi:hypothetical protein
MKKYLVAAVLIAAFATPALAEQFYVAFHKCSMMHSQPTGNMKSMGGPYATEAEAHKAMAGMAECKS